MTKLIKELSALHEQKVYEGEEKKKLNMTRVHTVMLEPDDMNTKDKVFGIRNEDPIVEFMLEVMGVPRDGTAIRIRSGFMKYESVSKMLFIARFKSDLPGEQK